MNAQKPKWKAMPTRSELITLIILLFLIILVKMAEQFGYL